MDILTIHLTNATSLAEMELVFTPYETPIAQRWYTMLRDSNAAFIPHNPPRFYNFPSDGWTRERIVRELQAAIDTINDHTPGLIAVRPSLDMNKNTTNYLHWFFERHRGSVLNPSAYFNTAPKIVRQALETYNLLIHRWEDFGRAARIIVPFDVERRPLEPEDYPHFTLAKRYGQISLHYNEVGKQLWDVFCDDDDVIGDDNIRPLRFYSCNFVIWFGNDLDHASRLTRFNQWFDRKEQYLNSLGFIKNSPELCLGTIPLAELYGDYESDLTDQIADHSKIAKLSFATVVQW